MFLKGKIEIHVFNLDKIRLAKVSIKGYKMSVFISGNFGDRYFGTEYKSFLWISNQFGKIYDIV